MRHRMTYSPATRAMRAMFAAHAESDRTGIPVDEIIDMRRERGIGRREVLKGAAVIGASAAVLPGIAASRASASTARIAIVGAGLAGLRAAHMLWTSKGVASTVYEADTSHLGGRCWSLRGFFSNGLIGEHGGAFINHDQTTIRNLIAQLGLQEEVVNGGDLPVGEQIYWFDGQPYTYTDANNDWGTIGYPVFKAAALAAPWPQLYNRYTDAGKQIDNMNIPQWLDYTGIGSNTRFGRLMLANSVSEYGGDPSDQSALNLLYLLFRNSPNQLQPMSGYDEKYHVVGGNDQIVTGMVDQLPDGSIKSGYQLVALARNSDNSYTLTFQVDSTLMDVTADHVVLALPFTTLKNVDLSKSGLSAFKMSTIQAGVLGSNAKIHVQLSRKTWPALGYSGSTYTDYNGFCVAWDDSVPLGPDGAPAILLGFPGAAAGATTLTGAPHGPAPAKDVTWFLNQIEPIYPGTAAAYTGVAYEDHWAVDPWHHGAYSYWRVGQYTTSVGYEMVQEGNIHFAGEHSEWSDAGFLDGAVVSGERVCKEIASQI